MEDERWADLVRKALLRTRTALLETASKRPNTLLQWDTLKSLVDKEARGLAHGEEEKAELAKTSLQQALVLPGILPLKRVAQAPIGEEVDEAEVALERWNQDAGGSCAGRRGGRMEWRRPPHICGKKAFPSWLEVHFPLSTDAKGSTVRWYL